MTTPSGPSREALEAVFDPTELITVPEDRLGPVKDPGAREVLRTLGFPVFPNVWFGLDPEMGEGLAPVGEEFEWRLEDSYDHVPAGADGWLSLATLDNDTIVLDPESGKVWCLPEDGGIYLFNSNLRQFVHFLCILQRERPNFDVEWAGDELFDLRSARDRVETAMRSVDPAALEIPNRAGPTYSPPLPTPRISPDDHGTADDVTDDGTLRIFGPVGPEEPDDAPARRLTGLRVPAAVGPYFATSDRDPVALGDYAAVNRRRVAREECADWARLGGDNGFELCADGEGTVRAVLLDYDEDDRFVNSSPQAFASGLAELRETLRVILATDQPSTAAAAFERLGKRLRALDPQAFEERENWWPLVLDDIRDTASVENYAAFEHLDPEDGKRIVTQAGAIAQHPEERLWATLSAAGVEPDQVLRVHTDLQPCFMPGHYCSLWLAQFFPQAEMTHSFPYGETADSRAEGVRRLREATDNDDQADGA